jgi:hypothetical protein
MTFQQKISNYPLANEFGEAANARGLVTPPAYGGPQRDAINACVDNIVDDICGKVGELRKTLDAIEAAVLQSAARSKAMLNDHVGICIRVNDEIRHMREVVEDLAREAANAA